MNSLINSIYISKVVQNQSTKIKDSEGDEHRNINEINNTIMNKLENNYYNFNDGTDLAAFLKLHVHKIYFYDDIYNLLQNFIEKKKIKYELNKDNCESIGKFLGTLIKNYINLTNEYNKLKIILGEYLKSNNKI